MIKQINQLTDEQLLDIGINRCDIDDLIWLDTDKQKSGIYK
jgi:hypothetical protein